MKKVVGGEVLRMVTQGMGLWLDSKNARITGLNKGRIILALEDKDFRKFYKDLFKEDYSEQKDA